MTDGKNNKFTLGSHRGCSAYAIDGGLWEACLESSRVMARAFLRIKLPNASLKRRPQNASTLPTTLPFGNPASIRRRSTIFPFNDIIVVSEYVLHGYIAGSLKLKLFLNQLPMKSTTIRRYAMEYDPNMVNIPGNYQGVYNRMMETIISLGKRTTVYLIDHKLRRRRTAAASKSRYTCVANGGSYVEAVNRNDWEYGPERQPGGLFSFLYIDTVNCLVKDHQDDIVWEYTFDHGPLAKLPDPPARLAVLAWLPD
ncbi:hypothetical protein NLG97_g4505 [Lecanicillium saksenae]|uniref:Uncharacterized protein n=1 Tax=Lecanicillium saksenae TaxID=468837 RepID=A0ACC1QWS5_9HYPO|nr:hypothetical protein NLG97_g4505 [Lecanicillium saksenae]